MRDCSGAAHGIAEKDFIRGTEIGFKKKFLLRRKRSEKMRTLHARKKSAAERRRIPAGTTTDEQIRNAPLRELAARIAENHFVKPGCTGGG